MVRARWSALPPERVRLHTAYSLEAVNDEVVFVLGPVLVTTLATLVDRSAGLALAATLALGGGLALAAQRGTQPPVTPRGSRAVGAAAARPRLPMGTVGPVVLVFVCLGALFGAMEVTTVGFADEHGSPALAGPLLAVFATGSLLSGLVYGTLRLRSDPDRRYLLGVAALTVALAPLPFVRSPWVLGVVVLAAGVAISPTLVTGNLLITERVPGGRLTEALAWTGTGLGAGVALGSGLAGAVIDAFGASPAYGVAVLSGALGTLVAAARLPAARRARARVPA
jgi:predicted MFS family arabinose efflux permease